MRLTDLFKIFNKPDGIKNCIIILDNEEEDYVMGIKTVNKTVYKCSDGQIFEDKQKAKDHEFDLKCPPSNSGLNPTELRGWLLKNRNFVLDYIGTQYDPVTEESKNG